MGKNIDINQTSKLSVPFYHIPLQTTIKRFREISFIEKHILRILSNGIKCSEEDLDNVISELLNVKQDLIRDLLLPYRENNFIRSQKGKLNVDLNLIIEDQTSVDWKAKIAVEDQIMDFYFSDLMRTVYPRSRIASYITKSESTSVESKNFAFSILENQIMEHIDGTNVSVNHDYYQDTNFVIEANKLDVNLPVFYKFSYDVDNDSIELKMDSVRLFKAQEEPLNLLDQAAIFVIKEIEHIIVLPEFVQTIRKVPKHSELSDEYVSSKLNSSKLETELLRLDEMRNQELSSDKDINLISEEIKSLNQKINDLKSGFSEVYENDNNTKELLSQISNFELDISAYNALLTSDNAEMRTKHLNRIQEIQRDLKTGKQKLKQLENDLKKEMNAQINQIQSQIKERRDTKSLLEKEITKEFEERRNNLIKDKKKILLKQEEIKTKLEQLSQLESDSMRDAFNGLIVKLSEVNNKQGLVEKIKINRQNLNVLYAAHKNSDYSEFSNQENPFIDLLELDSLFNRTLPELTELTHEEFEGFASTEAEIYQLMIDKKNVCQFIDKSQKDLLKKYRDNYNFIRHQFSNKDSVDDLNISKDFLFRSFQQFYSIIEKLMKGYTKLI